MPYKKLSSLLVIFSMMFVKTSVFGQPEALSKHQFKFYSNEIEKSSASAVISIIILGDTIDSNNTEGFYYFPSIDTSNQFDIIVKVNDIIFSGQGYPGWILNKGTRMTFGKLTNLKKLTSVADYNGLTEKDEGWEWFSKRFFVANRVYTIDIDNRHKIRELHFLIISPNSSDRLITTQKIIR